MGYSGAPFILRHRYLEPDAGQSAGEQWIMERIVEVICHTTVRRRGQWTGYRYTANNSAPVHGSTIRAGRVDETSALEM